MRSKMWFTAAAMFALASIAAAQNAPQKPTRTAADIITVVGCVQKEADYRAQKSDSKGGVANTGVGVANEFVLRGAHTVSPDTYKPIRTTEGLGETVYSLTGKLESEVAKSVGHQIAVSGYVVVADSEGTQKVKDLPMLNVDGWHEVSSSCDAKPAAPAKEPAPAKK